MKVTTTHISFPHASIAHLRANVRQLKKKKSSKTVDAAASASDEAVAAAEGEKSKLKKTKSIRKKTPIKVNGGADGEAGEAGAGGAETPSEKVR